MATDIRAELQRLTSLPPWGRIQQDRWDEASRFIYRIQSLDELCRETRRVAAAQGFPLRDLAAYVVRRCVLIENQPRRTHCAGRRPAPTRPVGEGLWRATLVGTLHRISSARA